MDRVQYRLWEVAMENEYLIKTSKGDIRNTK